MRQLESGHWTGLLLHGVVTVPPLRRRFPARLAL